MVRGTDSYLASSLLTTGYRSDVTEYEAGIGDRSDFGVAFFPSSFDEANFHIRFTDVKAERKLSLFLIDPIGY